MDEEVTVPTSPKNDSDAESSEGEDGGALDWSRLPNLQKAAIDRPTIPKRGEKDYEPARGPSNILESGSNLQNHALERARSAMYSALRADRGISSKSISYGLWFPQTAHVEVIQARGTMFAGMGFSNMRTCLNPQDDQADGEKTAWKSLELLPEEALFLIERGSMYCWRVDSQVIPASGRNKEKVPGDVVLEDVLGVPMSVQQAFAEMISGDTGLSLEKYQVYAYLKRLGYTIIRAQKPRGIESYPTTTQVLLFDTLQWYRSWGLCLSQWLKTLWTSLLAPFNWLKPIGLRGWRPWLTAADIFKKLRVIPAGHNVPLKLSMPCHTSPYTPFYHVFKPSTPFRRSTLPPPDFSIIVIGARTTPLPSLQEMTTLFDSLPRSPIPGPRKRMKSWVPTESSPRTPSTSKVVANSRTPSALQTRMLAFFWPDVWRSESSYHPSRPNPFSALKAGTKSFVVASVDGGSISFTRFGQGCFEEWPIM